MTKYTITYHRKVQVREYEMLDIGLAQEFDTKVVLATEAFTIVKDTVNRWIAEERAQL